MKKTNVYKKKSPFYVLCSLPPSFLSCPVARVVSKGETKIPCCKKPLCIKISSKKYKSSCLNGPVARVVSKGERF